MGVMVVVCIALIYEGRRLLRGLSQCLWFAFSVYLALFGVMVVSAVMSAPPVLTGVQLFWLIWVIVPTLAMGLLAAPRAPDLMTAIAEKTTEPFGVPTHYKLLTQWLLRFGPSVAAYLFTFNWFLRDLYGPKIAQNSFFWSSVENAPVLSLSSLSPLSFFSFCSARMRSSLTALAFVCVAIKINAMNRVRCRIGAPIYSPHKTMRLWCLCSL